MMTEEEILETCHAALKRFGHMSQFIQGMEECGELIQQLAKAIDPAKGSVTLSDELLEEIVDVQIMIVQLESLFADESVTRMFEKKTLKLQRIIEGKV